MKGGDDRVQVLREYSHFNQTAGPVALNLCRLEEWQFLAVQYLELAVQKLLGEARI